MNDKKHETAMDEVLREAEKAATGRNRARRRDKDSEEADALSPSVEAQESVQRDDGRRGDR
ncbi:hypothetical protein [Streptomyces sp. t39]|uniref:hypothetical protein n=1 Tax=Streptomyces sp. t39 TaxID=1828156 RepID=UPI0011CD73E6|nr:hypothetical protein [Streptomyces sp. t39]TXS52325.1 hypothetical protein EAO77_21320 [Streptomyces sp. t39]